MGCGSGNGGSGNESLDPFEPADIGTPTASPGARLLNIERQVWALDMRDYDRDERLRTIERELDTMDDLIPAACETTIRMRAVELALSFAQHMGTQASAAGGQVLVTADWFLDTAARIAQFVLGDERPPPSSEAPDGGVSQDVWDRQP